MTDSDRARTRTRRPMRTWTRRAIVAGVFLATATWPLWSGAISLAVHQDRQQEPRKTPEGQQQAPAAGRQAPDDAQLAEMMKRYEAAGKPGKFHDFLKPLEGEWNVAAETLGPDGSTTTSTGYSKNTWQMGNRFLRQEVSGNMMGRSFNALGFTGYDNVAGKYQSVWMDEMSSGMFYAEGEAGEDGKTITFTGEGTDPMSGQVKSYRHVVRIVDNDNHAFEMFEPGPQGEMTRTVTMTYKRVKKEE